MRNKIFLTLTLPFLVLCLTGCEPAPKKVVHNICVREEFNRYHRVCTVDGCGVLRNLKYKEENGCLITDKWTACSYRIELVQEGNQCAEWRAVEDTIAPAGFDL